MTWFTNLTMTWFTERLSRIGQRLYLTSAGLRRDDSGSVMVFVAVAFPVLIGGIGLGAEAGYWYLRERALQHAADVSAYSAAVRLRGGDPDEVLNDVVLHVATKSGYQEAGGTLAMHRPPTSGENAGRSGMVEVVLTQSIPRSFSGFFLRDPVAVHGRAVAGFNDVICVLALSKTANDALIASGSADARFDNCIVASNSKSSSAVHMKGATFRADCIYSAGGYKETGGSNAITLTDCDRPATGVDPFADPYTDKTVPTTATPCIDGSSIQNTTVTPTLDHPSGSKVIRFCSLNISGDVVFEPGIYIIDGNFGNTGHTNVSGSGVTFVVGGDVKLNGNATLTFSAPTSGSYAGMLFFGDRDATQEKVQITGNTGSTLTGAIYFPTGNLTYTGSSTQVGGCTQIVANTIAFAGNSSLRTACGGSGVKDIVATNAFVKLLE